MDIGDLREFCLSLGGVIEKTPFGRFSRRYDSILVFYVLGHMFCIVDMDNFTSVTVMSTPQEKEEMKVEYMSVEEPLNRGLKNWIQVNLGGDIPDRKIRALIESAYHIVKTKYSTKR